MPSVRTRGIGCVQSAHAHVVIAGIDAVDVVVLDEEGFHHLLAVLTVPVARLAVDQRHVGADLGQTLLEAFAALDGGRVAGLTGDLDHAGLVLDAQFGEPLAHDLGRARALRDVVGTGERVMKSKPSSAMLELVMITGISAW
jgi:hypothetical protein